MYETKDVYNQNGEKFIEHDEQFPGCVNNLSAVKNGIFISDWDQKGIKFFDHQNKKVYQISPSFISQGWSANSLINLGNNRFILLFCDNRNSIKVMVKIQY